MGQWSRESINRATQTYILIFDKGAKTIQQKRGSFSININRVIGHSYEKNLKAPHCIPKH